MHRTLCSEHRTSTSARRTAPAAAFASPVAAAAARRGASAASLPWPLVICLVPALLSWYHAHDDARPTPRFGIRTVEWLRDNGARGLVNKVESIYYSLNGALDGRTRH